MLSPQKSRFSRQAKLIYIIECSNQKYLVGSIKKDNKEFILESCISYAPRWTSVYPPLRVLETLIGTNEMDEDRYTKIYMKNYGISNVRGGKYRELVLSKKDLEIIQKDLDGISQDKEFSLCYATSPTESYETDSEDSSSVDSEDKKLACFDKNKDKANNKNNSKEVTKMLINDTKSQTIKDSNEKIQFENTSNEKAQSENTSYEKAQPEKTSNEKAQTKNTSNEKTQPENTSKISQASHQKLTKPKASNLYIPQPKIASNNCGRCYRPGHVAKDCEAITRADGTIFLEEPDEEPVQQSKAIICARCARTGHSVKECFAKRKYDGSAIVEKQNFQVVVCPNCNKPGHTAKECTFKPKFHQSFPKGENGFDSITCYKCLRKGHTANKCYAKKKANGESINDEGFGDQYKNASYSKPGYETKEFTSSGDGSHMNYFDRNNKGNYKKFYPKKPQDSNDDTRSLPYKKHKY